LQLFRKLLNHVIYKHIRTRYNTGTELQYVIRQPEFRPKVQNISTSDVRLITKEKQVKTIRHSVFRRVSFFLSIFSSEGGDRSTRKTPTENQKSLENISFLSL